MPTETATPRTFEASLASRRRTRQPEDRYERCQRCQQEIEAGEERIVWRRDGHAHAYDCTAKPREIEDARLAMCAAERAYRLARYAVEYEQGEGSLWFVVLVDYLCRDRQRVGGPYRFGETASAPQETWIGGVLYPEGEPAELVARKLAQSWLALGTPPWALGRGREHLPRRDGWGSR